MERFPLVDELLVIDSESDDDTRRIAADEGARVVVHSDVLPALRQLPGQGRGAVEEPLRDDRRSDRLVRHGHRRLASALPVTDPLARCSPSRASAMSRRITSARSSRAGSSRRAAAAA